MISLLLFISIGLTGNLLFSMISPSFTFAEFSSSASDSDNDCSGDSSELGIWLYPSEFKKIDKKIIKAMKEKEMNTLYLSLEHEHGQYVLNAKIKNFVVSAKKLGLKVYAVILQDPTFIFLNGSELHESFGKIVKNTKQIFNGYIVDVEPHTKKRADPRLYLTKYVGMSKSIHRIADHYNVKYFDTVPIWYHEEMKKLGIKDGLNSLFSNGLYLLDYEATVEKAMKKYLAIKDELNRCVVVNIKVTPGFGEPNLKPSEISNAIHSIKKTGAGIGIFEANYTLSLNSRQFHD